MMKLIEDDMMAVNLHDFMRTRHARTVHPECRKIVLMFAISNIGQL
jgi:hypothetical protein